MFYAIYSYVAYIVIIILKRELRISYKIEYI